MNFDGNKPLVDQRRNPLIGIDLGIQPGASPSHWSGAEIQQYETILLLRLRQASVHVGFPVYWHDPYLQFHVFNAWMRIASSPLRNAPTL
jgi:hypothetical protein